MSTPAVGSSRTRIGRRMDHRLGDQQPPLHPAREGARIGVGLVLETDRAEQLLGPPPRLGHAVEAGLDLERLARREEGVEHDLLRDDADRRLGVARMPVDVEAPDRGAAAALVDQAGEDVDQGRLAGAVGPEQPEYLAPRHVEADPVQRPLAAGIGLLEIDDRDGGGGHGGGNSAGNRAAGRQGSSPRRARIAYGSPGARRSQ